MTHQGLLAKTVLEERETDVAGPDKHDRRRQPDLETVHVVAVHGELEAEQDVVDDTDRNSRGDTVYGRLSANATYGQEEQNSQYENMYDIIENL